MIKQDSCVWATSLSDRIYQFYFSFCISQTLNAKPEASNK